jgi:hypothetical protein
VLVTQGGETLNLPCSGLQGVSSFSAAAAAGSSGGVGGVDAAGVGLDTLRGALALAAGVPGGLALSRSASGGGSLSLRSASTGGLPTLARRRGITGGLASGVMASVGGLASGEGGTGGDLEGSSRCAGGRNRRASASAAGTTRCVPSLPALPAAQACATPTALIRRTGEGGTLGVGGALVAVGVPIACTSGRVMHRMHRQGSVTPIAENEASNSATTGPCRNHGGCHPPRM